MFSTDKDQITRRMENTQNEELTQQASYFAAAAQ